jgi:hypothetical protein
MSDLNVEQIIDSLEYDQDDDDEQFSAPLHNINYLEFDDDLDAFFSTGIINILNTLRKKLNFPNLTLSRGGYELLHELLFEVFEMIIYIIDEHRNNHSLDSINSKDVEHAIKQFLSHLLYERVHEVGHNAVLDYLQTLISDQHTTIIQNDLKLTSLYTLLNQQNISDDECNELLELLLDTDDIISSYYDKDSLNWLIACASSNRKKCAQTILSKISYSLHLLDTHFFTIPLTVCYNENGFVDEYSEEIFKIIIENMSIDLINNTNVMDMSGHHYQVPLLYTLIDLCPHNHQFDFEQIIIDLIPLGLDVNTRVRDVTIFDPQFRARNRNDPFTARILRIASHYNAYMKLVMNILYDVTNDPDVPDVLLEIIGQYIPHEVPPKRNTI